MNQQIDIIDQLVINPVKKVKDKKTIPAKSVFQGIKSNKKIKLPKSYSEKLTEIQKRTIIPKK
tara:strand:- start:99 stop:287 length:189 start_codon:yes stop_codon:yes gene_type:complete